VDQLFPTSIFSIWCYVTSKYYLSARGRGTGVHEPSSPDAVESSPGEGDLSQVAKENKRSKGAKPGRLDGQETRAVPGVGQEMPKELAALRHLNLHVTTG